jgi:molybdopterin-guanine dinucleotide biosynthesis protein A
MNLGGIILCGGLSIRMGTAKLALPFGPELMIQRIARLLGEACRPIVVVAAAGQQLPALPASIKVARDSRPGRGPLEGLLAGLSALGAEADAAYATSCDVPFLVPAFVRRMFELLGDDAVAVPVSGGFTHPLSAVYRPTLVEVIETLLASGRLRPADLFNTVATRRVEEKELRDVDPRFDTLKNLNHPADYLAALDEAGFSATPAVLELLKPRHSDE